MGKFLLGLLTGAVVAILLIVIAGFAIASLRTKQVSIADGSTLVLHLSGDAPETPPVDITIPFLQPRAPVTVENIWTMLRNAAADSRIKAVVFEPSGSTVGWAKMQEIRADLEQFRHSGKPLFAYLKAPNMRDYYMASACSRIYLAPVDELDLKGVGLELMYFKNTLDKLGVHVDVEHAGKYKDYGDQFTRSSMSPETNEVMSSLVDDIYGDLVNTIAKARRKSPETIKAVIDNGPFLSKQAKDEGLVDELRYEDEAFGELKTLLHQTELKKTTEQEYVNVPDTAVGNGGRDRIAFVVGEGTITRGDSNITSLSTDTGLESETFDKMLDRVANDKSIKGVIVRIDSPGGEVSASDDMWRAMNELHKKKPVVISMSDDAASGGYYMAMSGDTLVAYPGTLTGSIGVVFGKPNLHGLYDKLGITKDSVSRGRFAQIESDYQSLSDVERMKLRAAIDTEYEDFVGKVAAARKKPASVIEPLAQGRVWMGDQAKANGLVDELGGLDRAVELIKAKSGIPSGDKVSLVLYPPKKSILDLLFHPNADAEADAMLSGVGLAPLRNAWHDAGLRVWMRGGMLRMMPFSIQIR
ncbi:MAG TPA: signal peptide peptidase SppA [Bryobacteraceae bacterium]|jgi:protease-4|nr:signal peptide peptidase SppA [Bryobacteraceae bacterium]